MSTKWSVNRTESAQRDFVNIIHWTVQRFGARQAAIYSENIALALEALESGPDTIGVKKRDDIAPGILTLHLARNGRKGRHFILFRIAEPHTIDVLRLLHDSMDFAAHLGE